MTWVCDGKVSTATTELWINNSDQMCETGYHSGPYLVILNVTITIRNMAYNTTSFGQGIGI